MSPSTARTKVIREVELIPEDRLADVYTLLHYFRIGLQSAEKQGRSVMQFAGCWEDMPSESFDSFLHEVGERRRRAFSGRRSDETGAD